jgi:hypothetical protein
VYKEKLEVRRAWPVERAEELKVYETVAGVTLAEEPTLEKQVSLKR